MYSVQVLSEMFGVLLMYIGLLIICVMIYNVISYKIGNWYKGRKKR